MFFGVGATTSSRLLVARGSAWSHTAYLTIAHIYLPWIRRAKSDRPVFTSRATERHSQEPLRVALLGR